MNVYDFAPDLDLSKGGGRRFYFWGERNRRQ